MKGTNTMDELHRLRAENYEKTKNLSAEEYMIYLDQRSKEIMHKYDLHLEIVAPRWVKPSRL